MGGQRIKNPIAIPAAAELRQVPHNLEAERAVLASILMDNEILSVVTGKLLPESFYAPAHATLYGVMSSLYNQRKPVNNVSLSEELIRMGQLQAVGGATYLAQILETVSTAVNIDYYVEVVKEKFILRSLISEAEGIIRNCYQPDADVGQLLDETEKRVLGVGRSNIDLRIQPFKDLIRQGLETIEHRYKSKVAVTGLATGFKDFDDRTSGLQPSDLIILAARPSMGKTSFALNIIEHVALYEKKPVAFFSLEMSRDQVVMRMLCTLAQINLQKVRTGFISDKEFPIIASAAARLSTAPVYIDDTPGITVMELRAKARRLKLQFDVSMLVVDYLQLMQANPSKRSESRQQDVSEISRSLKGLARELGVPIIAISQLNRAAEQRDDHKPRLSDLRESGSLEQDADLVVMLMRHEYYDPEAGRGLAVVDIAKQRNGPVGNFNMVFRSEITRFFDYSPEDNADVEFQPEE